MPERKLRILFTRGLAEQEIRLAKSYGIEVSPKPFTEYVVDADEKRIKQHLSSDTNGFIFTSARAIGAIASVIPATELRDELSSKATFAVGEETASSIRQYGVNPIVPNAHNAAGLATEIISRSDTLHLTYFCSKIRRPDMVQALRASGLAIEEEVVYDTTGIKVDSINPEDYDAITFYSPSAVRSYLNQYELTDNLEIFAIGNTTRTALLESGREVMTPSKPNTSSMLCKIKEYYQLEDEK